MGVEATPGGSSHSHLGLLGFELSLPDVSRESAGVDGGAGLIRLLGDFAHDAGPATGWLDALAFATTLSAPREAFARGPDVAPRPPVNSPPLCDLARRERTGVLRT
ncbi:MAG: hypothetical protein BGO49_27585 [Planctomycetales bacterium 71-10]|nr:MAG: hypothetical protein BGO49_27585 [Planctomycetales bacterium 71-10]